MGEWTLLFIMISCEAYPGFQAPVCIFLAWSKSPCFYSFFRKRKGCFRISREFCERNRAIIFWEFWSRFFPLSSLSLPVAGDLHGCHDPHPVPARAVGYEGYAVGGAGFFSVNDGVGEDEGGPGGGVCPLPCAGPCQGLPVTLRGTYDHVVSDVVRVLVP
jgi:hypothetical protein